MKRIAFMGSDEIALPVLEYLWKNHSLKFDFEGIISQPDKPSGRGKQIRPNPVAQWASDYGLYLLQPVKPGKEEIHWLKEEAQIDLVLVMAYGHIIKEDMRNLPPLGMVNFHTSLLPKYRGASPINAALLNGDTQTGVSLMQMVKKMDAGGILDQAIVNIEQQDTFIELKSRLAHACVPLLDKNLDKLLENEAQFRPQEEAQATYCRKIKKEDGWLNFHAGAFELVNQFRALTPWPGVYFEHKNTLIKVKECHAVHGTGEPGKVLKADKKGVLVGTGQGLFNMTRLQKPGSKALTTEAFLNGFKIEEGAPLVGKEIEPIILKK